MKTTTDELLSNIEEWAEHLANLKGAASLAMPAHIHAQCLKSGVSAALSQMCEVLKNNGREVPTGE